LWSLWELGGAPLLVASCIATRLGIITPYATPQRLARVWGRASPQTPVRVYSIEFIAGRGGFEGMLQHQALFYNAAVTCSSNGVMTNRVCMLLTCFGLCRRRTARRHRRRTDGATDASGEDRGSGDTYVGSQMHRNFWPLALHHSARRSALCHCDSFRIDHVTFW